MLRLGEIRKAKGSTRDTKRLGRGQSSGQGGTAGKGHKGQKARAGGRVRAGFEGGQNPLYRRVPKRGFTNIFAKEFAIINLTDLETAGLAEVSLVILKEKGILKTKFTNLKVLGTGTIKKAIKIKTAAISKSAREKIEKAGGSVEITA